MKTEVTVEATFLAGAKKLPPDRRKAAATALMKFTDEPSLPSLRFRPLQKLKGFYIISSVHGDRIILRKDGDHLYAAVDVGPHDNVYRRWNRR